MTFKFENLVAVGRPGMSAGLPSGQMLKTIKCLLCQVCRQTFLPLSRLLIRSGHHDLTWAENHHVDGLSAAYATESGLVRRGNVLYTAGTKSSQDVADDSHTPFNGVDHTQRCNDALPMMRGVDVVVGHSHGGSVALSFG